MHSVPGLHALAARVLSLQRISCICSCQRSGNALLGALLSSYLQIKLSLVVSDRAQRAPPVQGCCATCACRMPAVSALAQEYRNTPFYLLALSPSVKYRAPLQRCAQGALVISGLFTYKICLCLKDLMKCKFLVFQCDAFLKTG